MTRFHAAVTANIQVPAFFSGDNTHVFQRLAMFGAQKDDLPEIWRQLIEAGFETGHAYAKALRMAKTCVGSTWCRYGVGDSVGLGVELENRYKGIRTPHKMKFGVSGCTRECSEAQGKDVGIIATENHARYDPLPSALPG